MVLALTATVSGIDGFLWLIACLAFLVAAIVCAVKPPAWAWVLIASGLCLAALTHLVH